MDPNTVVQLIVGVGGFAGLAGLVGVLFSRKKIIAEAHKMKTDAAQVISATSIAMLQPLKDEITILDSKLNDRSHQVDDLDTKLKLSNRRIEDMEAMIDKMTVQLKYYVATYGPPPDYLQ